MNAASDARCPHFFRGFFGSGLRDTRLMRTFVSGGFDVCSHFLSRVERCAAWKRNRCEPETFCEQRCPYPSIV
jgi:hypothetical protein